MPSRTAALGLALVFGVSPISASAQLLASQQSKAERGLKSHGDDEAEMLKRAWAERQARLAKQAEARRSKSAATGKLQADINAVRKAARQEAERRDIDNILERLEGRIDQAKPKLERAGRRELQLPSQRTSNRTARRLLGLSPNATPLPKSRDTQTARSPTVSLRASDDGAEVSPNAEPRVKPTAKSEPSPGWARNAFGAVKSPEASEHASRAMGVREPNRERSDPAPSWDDDRVTILLAMRPGRRGIRRVNKTADPIICIRRRCFISQGASITARDMRRGKAFGTVNTLGKRSGACRHSLNCVFRGIPLGTAGRATVQPVDLRLMRHDRRERRVVEADNTCKLIRGRLSCAQRIESETYTLWIVPERLAQRAGARALQAALADGLQGDRTASLEQ
ncbi:MAG: hypothetical protein AAFR23_02505 [Pseudomonadota bacterium]